MNKFTRIALIGALMTGVLVVGDFDITPTVSAQSTLEKAKKYSRKTYKPTAKRRIRNVGYVGDFSDVVCNTKLTADDVYYFNPEELRILRNTIYARHGRKFRDAKLRQYFSQFDWYHPTKTEVNPGELTSIEQHNIMLIQSFE